MEMPCCTGNGLLMSMVTLPDFALSELLSNLNAPLGSAESLSVVPPPPDVVGVVLVVAVAAGVVDVLLLLFLLLPQPATASTATRARAAYSRFDFILFPPSRVDGRPPGN